MCGTARADLEKHGGSGADRDDGYYHLGGRGRKREGDVFSWLPCLVTFLGQPDPVSHAAWFTS